MTITALRLSMRPSRVVLGRRQWLSTVSDASTGETAQPTAKQSTVLRVSADDVPIRADRLLHKRIPSAPRALIQRLFRQRKVYQETDSAESDATNTSRSKRSRVRRDTMIETPEQALVVPRALEPFLDQDTTTLLSGEEAESSEADTSQRNTATTDGRVVYQDRDILVVDKPNFMAVTAGSGLSTLFRQWIQDLIPSSFQPVPAFSLHPNSSGLLVLARTKAMARQVHAAWSVPKCIRHEYWAVLVDEPKGRKGTMKMPLVRCPSSTEPNHPRMVPWTEVDDTDDQRGLTAVTDFEHIDGHRPMCLIKVRPQTFRRDQILVHFSRGLELPIAGDYIYDVGARGDDEKHRRTNAILKHARIANSYGVGLQFPPTLPDTTKGGGYAEESGRLTFDIRQVEKSLPLFLHSATLEFPHPRTLKPVRVSAPLPSHMATLWERLGVARSKQWRL